MTVTVLRPTRSLGLGGAGEQQQGTRNGVSPSWNTARRCDGMFHGCLVQRPAASDLPPFTAAFIAGNRFAREHGGPIKMSSRQIGEPLRVPSVSALTSMGPRFLTTIPPLGSICVTRAIVDQAALRDPVFGARERVGFWRAR